MPNNLVPKCLLMVSYILGLCPQLGCKLLKLQNQGKLETTKYLGLSNLSSNTCIVIVLKCIILSAF